MTRLLTLHDGPRLRPLTPVLIRPSGTVQLGWDPDSAVVVRPPAGATAESLADVLRMLDGRRSHDEIVWQANRSGIDSEDIERILSELASAGALLPPLRGRTVRDAAVRSVHIHGQGPLADGIADTFGAGSVRISRSAPDIAADTPAFHRSDCVILTDDLVPDPCTVTALMESGTAHLAVRLRDGRGLVGPLVLPGQTSCLRCADLVRTARDPEWPRLAAQLLGRIGHAGPDTVRATAALAVSEVTVLLDRDDRGGTLWPACLNTTLELDLRPARLLRRSWRPHPDCGCSTVNL